MGYEERPLVSTDYVNDPRSGIVDAACTQVIDKTMVKIYAWWVCRGEGCARCRLLNLIDLNICTYIIINYGCWWFYRQQRACRGCGMGVTVSTAYGSEMELTELSHAAGKQVVDSEGLGMAVVLLIWACLCTRRLPGGCSKA